jgi:predicted outer membrane repeat protein
MFHIFAGSLTLGKGVTLEGTINNEYSLIRVGDTLKMLDGSKIIGNTATQGGGVVIGNGGEFIMEAGSEIIGNTATNFGGGVYVESGGTFTMEGGELTSNTAVQGGGVLV